MGFGHIEVVKCLVSQGCDIRVKTNFAVNITCTYGHSKVVKYLVSQGAKQMIKIFRS
ncbi:ankyrin repeat-containing protein [Acanthamoeba polyphaga mimivirus]|uniref:Ankyrin repeat-containing protein n=1 Tax=Acanthamoeba polyphaga mimivirus Kroon TaxID=3069720 RepID=A0A0G2Y7S7_9VIRU|nr:ankyrin repeat-containing protein [Acanthamoeba polyphaga mimivirus]AKI80604.1 ankyrin repeat-containing protein [Acanthamoeba polyphaga mimivirus Kroon]